MGHGLLTGLGIAVAFAAGVAVGMVGGVGGDTETDSGREPADGAPSPSPSGAGEAGPSGRAGSGPASAPTTPRARAQDASVADATPPKGDGVITGTVRSSKGDPVEGIDVVASAAQPAEWAKDLENRRFEDLPLDERVARFVRSERWRDATTRRARSGADGTFTLEGVPDLAHFVSGRSETYRVRVARGSSGSDVRPGGKVDLTAEPRSGLLVEVFLPDGTQPDTASVEFKRGNSSSSSGWTKPRQRIDADPGPAQFTVTAGKWSEFRSETIDIDVPETIPAEPRVVRLTPRRGMLVVAKPAPGFESLTPSIRVKGPAGDEIGGDRLSRLTAIRDMLPSAAGTAAAAERPYLDLEPGTHTVSVSHDGETFATADVAVAEGLARVEVEAPPPAAARVVEVTVTPAEAARGRVHFVWVREGPKSRSEWRAQSGSRGADTWVVLVPGPSDDRQGYSSSGTDDEAQLTWTLGLRVDNAPRGSVAWAPGTRSVTVAVQEPMWIDVVVDGVAGSGLERKIHASAWIVKRGERGGMASTGLGQATIDGKGRCRLGPYEPTTIELMLSAGSDTWGGPTIGRAVVEAGRGVREVRIPLPRLETVTIEVGSKRAGQSVWVRPKGDDRTNPTMGHGFHGTADAQGRWVVRHVPAGTYVAQINGAEQEFTVPGAATVTVPEGR